VNQLAPIVPGSALTFCERLKSNRPIPMHQAQKAAKSDRCTNPALESKERSASVECAHFRSDRKVHEDCHDPGTLKPPLHKEALHLKVTQFTSLRDNDEGRGTVRHEHVRPRSCNWSKHARRPSRDEERMEAPEGGFGPGAAGATIM
jgi:hypothetical protein